MTHVTGVRVDDSGIDNHPLILTPSLDEDEPGLGLVATPERSALIHETPGFGRNYHPFEITPDQLHDLNFKYRDMLMKYPGPDFAGEALGVARHQQNGTVYTPTVPDDLDLYPGLAQFEQLDAFKWVLSVGLISITGFGGGFPNYPDSLGIGSWPIYNSDLLDFDPSGGLNWQQGFANVIYSDGKCYPYVFFRAQYFSTSSVQQIDLCSVPRTAAFGRDMRESAQRLHLFDWGSTPLYITTDGGSGYDLDSEVRLSVFFNFQY